MYLYGKGAEFTFFTRLGNNISKINYDFDKTMQALCGEKLPDNVRFHINRKSSVMLEMYFKMFEYTKGSQEMMFSEGFNFGDCIMTILSGAFFYGQEVCSTIELSDNDKLVEYQEESDKPYNYDNYDKKYKLEDFKVINYRFGDFNEIKDQLGLL
jgi:hypothetical protein